MQQRAVATFSTVTAVPDELERLRSRAYAASLVMRVHAPRSSAVFRRFVRRRRASIQRCQFVASR
eukprot:1985306-Pleurochrysis_carterae.AAC.2